MLSWMMRRGCDIFETCFYLWKYNLKNISQNFLKSSECQKFGKKGVSFYKPRDMASNSPLTFLQTTEAKEDRGNLG
jgi:hypothetical protein